MALTLAGFASARAADGVHVIPEFTFESGERLADMKVAYTTHGGLNAAKDNAILVTHGTSGNRNSYNVFIGPGKAFDTEKYFVITVDGIGGGGSSGPKDGLGTRFPKYTVRDMVHAQHDLVTRGLGLSGLLAVGGPSMGAFQGLEWGIHYPDFMKGLLLIVPGARSDRHVHAIFDAVETAVKLDPKYRDGNYTENPTEGIVLGGMIYYPWLYTDEYINTIGDPEKWNAALRSFGVGWAKAWDANSLLWRYNASRNFDASAPFGGDLTKALSMVKARTLLMPSMTDRTLPPYMAREMYRGIRNATYVEIPTWLGHLGCCPTSENTAEYAFITAQIRSFLASLQPGG
ncbi:MAG TPA: alpha/beta fold hydrolase [Dehalococcoidia bacterium]|nr:alpha/beta fold hydrolase [Dehalococcoidia bacterium]